MNRPLKIIISGGGTGGHVFPAIAMADAFHGLLPDTEILFVGAEGKLEMSAVPKAGYRIIGLPITGLQRSLSMRNISLLFKLAGSMLRAWNIIGDFKPDAVIGVGGYASGPVLKVASWRRIPYFIQEQNSYAGITNKLLGDRAEAVFVAFPGMERFFPSGKIVMTGNPVRREDFVVEDDRDVTLADVDLAHREGFAYDYQFGEGWRVEVRIERVGPVEKKVAYPLCLAGERAGPPEDCGGIDAYHDMLACLQEPNTDLGREWREWLGPDYDPARCDLAAINRAAKASPTTAPASERSPSA